MSGLSSNLGILIFLLLSCVFVKSSRETEYVSNFFKKYDFSKLDEKILSGNEFTDYVERQMNSIYNYYGLKNFSSIFRDVIFVSFEHDPISLVSRSYRIMKGITLKKSCHLAVDGFRIVSNTSFEALTPFARATINDIILDDTPKFATIIKKFFVDRDQSTFLLNRFNNGDNDILTLPLLSYMMSLYGLNLKLTEYMIDKIEKKSSTMFISFKALLELTQIKGTPDRDQLNRLLNVFKEGAKKSDLISCLGFAVTAFMIRDVSEATKISAFQNLLFVHGKDIIQSRYYIGAFYEVGFGVESDLQTALKFYKDAAMQGSVHAIHKIALMNSIGYGTFTDCEVAAEFYHLAAYYMVSSSLKADLLVSLKKENYMKSYFIMLILSYLGEKQNLHNIGVLLLSKNKMNIPKSRRRELGFKFFSHATSTGVKQSWVRLGDCYYDGIGVEVNYEMAMDAYKEAYSNNDAAGAYSMAHMYHYHSNDENWKLETAKFFYNEAVRLDDKFGPAVFIKTIDLQMIEIFNPLFNFFKKNIRHMNFSFSYMKKITSVVRQMMKIYHYAILFHGLHCLVILFTVWKYRFLL